MIGSLIGDIVGSVYERYNIKTKAFPFFNKIMSRCTDDSVLTVATADWILHGGDVSSYYSKWANKYPNAGYGGSFLDWIWVKNKTGVAGPYNSCGNGSSMRVGPVGWAYNSVEETLWQAKVSAECTHNHPEGIKGAQAIAMAVFLARKKYEKADIRKQIEELFGYDLSFTCDDIREEYGWDSKYGNGVLCQSSVPQAIVAFLDGESFEDCVRTAISIGGDSDTIGCMTGSIAEAYYGIPNEIKEIAYNHFIPLDMRSVIEEFENIYN